MITDLIFLWEVAKNTDRCTCSPWATDTGRPKQNRQISTFHSTDGALCLCSVLIYRVSIRTRVRVRVRVNVSITVRVRVTVSVRVKVSIMWQNTIIMVAFYNMLPRPEGRFFYSSADEFPVMIIADNIWGRWLGLCRCAVIDINRAYFSGMLNTFFLTFEVHL